MFICQVSLDDNDHASSLTEREPSLNIAETFLQYLSTFRVVIHRLHGDRYLVPASAFLSVNIGQILTRTIANKMQKKINITSKSQP